jgi:maltose O-acetyltransferase
MGKLGRLFKKMHIKNLKMYTVFGRKKYMKHLCKIYKKYGVQFESQLPRFIASDVYFDTTAKIFIGEGTTITSNCLLLTHDHAIEYGYYACEANYNKEFRILKEIRIGKWSFIGQRTIILPGVTIGDNVIVGAGSIVTKDLKSNGVYAGAPAKFICSTSDYYKRRSEIDKEYIVNTN